MIFVLKVKDCCYVLITNVRGEIGQFFQLYFSNKGRAERQKGGTAEGSKG